MGVTFVANLQASKRVKPCNRTLDGPTRFAQATAMGRANLCEHRFDAALSQTLSMCFRTVAPVTLNDLRFVQWASPLASNVWNSIDECIKLGDVVAVRLAQDDRERGTFRVDDEVVFAAELAPVRWIRAGFFPRQHRANRRTVHKRSRQIDFATTTQFGQQRFVDALPNSCFLPCNESDRDGVVALPRRQRVSQARGARRALHRLPEYLTAGGRFQHEPLIADARHGSESRVSDLPYPLPG